MTSFHVLYESASGYALFTVLEYEEIGILLSQVQLSFNDFAKLQKIIKLLSFQPFDSAENALENINAITEHELTSDLKVIYNLFII